MQTLKEKVILVSGGGSGLGRHIAVMLGSYGATVAVNDINPDKADKTVKLVNAAGGCAKSYLADVAKKFPVQAMFNAIEDDWGRLDALINNARVVPHKPLLDMDEWEWRRTLDVNLTGGFILSQVGGRIMRTAGTGQIIQAVQSLSNAVDTAAYHSSTKGIEEMVLRAGAELGAAGLQIQTVHYKDDHYEQVTNSILALLLSE